MDPTQYNRLVRRLEDLARTRPETLRRNALSLVALGYVYVLTILLGLVAAIPAFLWVMAESHASWVNWLGVKGGLALVVVAWMIVKSLWVKVPEPEGLPLASGEAPKLEQRLAEIRNALDAPRPDVVLLTTDFNASVTQVPRLGIFGWPKTYLTLGVPLMCGVDARQLDAVLAHEFAHLSRSHPKTGLWIFRVSRTWDQLFQHLHTAGSRAGWLFERFFGWYVPRLQGHGYAMSRRDEFEADSEAAQFAGADAAGAALISLDVRAAALSERVWPEIWKRAESEPTPPARVWALMPELIRAEPVNDASIHQALQRRAADSDTHPSLADRLRALGIAEANEVSARVAATLDGGVAVTAAEYYLGDRVATIMEHADRDWRESVAEIWKANHERRREFRARSEVLLAKERDKRLEDIELYELAITLDWLDDGALSYLRRAVAALPDNAAAQFTLGHRLLKTGDEAGVQHVRAAMKLDVERVSDCAALLQRFYADRGRLDEAEAAQWDRYTNVETMRAIAAERSTVTNVDVLVPAELTATDISALCEIGESTPGVKAIWVARKETDTASTRPMIVVAVETRWWRWHYGTKKAHAAAQSVLDAIQLSFTADLFVTALNSNLGWLHKKMKAVPEAQIFEGRQ